MRRGAVFLLTAAVTTLLGVAAACSSYGESEEDGKAPPLNDSGAPDSTAAQEADGNVSPQVDAASRCDLNSEFKQITRVDSLSVVGIQELSARLTRDELAVVISRAQANGSFDLLVASRSSAKDPFGPATPLDTLNTGWMEAHASFSSDGLTVLFDSDRDGGQGLRDLYFATRSSGFAAFGNVTSLADINGATQDMMPYLLPSKQRLYFTSTREGNVSRLFVAPFGEKKGVVERVLSDPLAIGSHPVVTDDELEIFFSGREESSATAILWARRTSVDDPFGPAVPLVALNVTGASDRPTWISADACRLYFTSDRTAKDDYDVYVATR